MERCERCGRDFPAVLGADTQVCPHCGHEGGARAVASAPAGEAPRADPAGAAAHAFRLFAARWPAFLAAWAPAALVGALAYAAVEAYAASAGLPADPFAMTTGERMRWLGIALPLLLVAQVVNLASWCLVAARAMDAERPGAEALRAALRRPGALLALGALLTTAYLVGLMLLVVPFLVFFHWFLHAPAALAQEPGRGVGGALEASRRFARERRTMGFTALVLFVGLGVFVAGVVLHSLAAAALAAAGLDHPLAIAALGPLAAWPLAPLLPLLPASFWLLAARAPEAAPVRAGAPAAERFRTTKCPGCGTLVPYTATGQPVEVACPVCGRSGRVL